MINEVIRRTVRKPTGSRLSGAEGPYMNGDCVCNVDNYVDNYVDNFYEGSRVRATHGVS